MTKIIGYRFRDTIGTKQYQADYMAIVTSRIRR